MGKANMMAETTSHLTARLYAALKHTPGCSCGECSGGLNAVDEMERRILAAEAERDEANRLLREVVKADQQDAQMGYPIPGDSCMGAFIGLVLMQYLDALAKEDTDE